MFPLVLVLFLRSIFDNAAMALAIAGSIPTIRTIIILAWRRRVDWFGVIGTLGFIAALVVEAIFGGRSFEETLYIISCLLQHGRFFI
jgi:hypothetical protein